MKIKTSLLTFCCLLMTATAAEAAKFYKWTDAEGVTHYSADPPPDSAGETKEIKIHSRQFEDDEADSAVTAKDKKATSDTADKAADKTAGKDDEKKSKDGSSAKAPERYAEKCKGLKSDLDVLQTYARVKAKDPNGETHVLTEDEKNAQMEDTQRQIKAFCE